MRRNVAGLAIVSFIVFGIVLSGCGKLSEQDFEAWKEPYVAQNAQEHSELKNQVSNVDTKVEQNKVLLNDAINEAKEEAIAFSQQGDSDTIEAAKQFAQSEDKKVRDELTQTANQAGEKAQQFASSEDAQLREQIEDLANQAKTQTASLNQLKNSVEEAEKNVTAAKAEMASNKPRTVATVQFASGRTGLTQAAKQELDKAILEIKTHSDATIVVTGHADGRPVLSGRYRSNWDLSQARADAAAKYLKDNGVTNEIKVIGRAHTEPIAPVNTKAGRAMNRRAEVIIYPPGSMM